MMGDEIDLDDAKNAEILEMFKSEEGTEQPKNADEVIRSIKVCFGAVTVVIIMYLILFFIVIGVWKSVI